jgi:Fe-S-cluster-containing dehydrogenase component
VVKVLYADIDRCVGCHACEVACRQEFSFPLEETRIRILETEPEKVGERITAYFIPVVTDKCVLAKTKNMETPACVSACPTQAITYSDISKITKLTQKGKMICILKLNSIT